MAKIKKEVWVDPSVIKFIDDNYEGQYSRFIRKAVNEKISKESTKKD